MKSFVRSGWVFLERSRILSGIQFTTYFIEFLVVETKWFVGSFVNVILTRQTCGQRSSRAAESKHRALGNDFFERIYYMFLISKSREDWDLGLSIFWVLAKRKPLRNAKFRFVSVGETCFFSEVAVAYPQHTPPQKTSTSSPSKDDIARSAIGLRARPCSPMYVWSRTLASCSAIPAVEVQHHVLAFQWSETKLEGLERI